MRSPRRECDLASCLRLALLMGGVLSCWVPLGAKAPADEAHATRRSASTEHWAYSKLLPAVLPAVRDPSWPRGPVDAFVLARLEANSLRPSSEADRAALAKRLALTITGLPPTLDELDSLLTADGPDAVERFVERSLASPAYGERMAVPWLDLARYADTHGYHADGKRDMWRWRDWVIQAFNRNLPFDQFTIEQLAGDLVPNATLDQRLATGFQRNHMINFEDGAIDEEYRTEYVADRVATTATVWLAQTLHCARCHDHKHDPFTQRDYYRLFAYFNNVPERGVEKNEGNARPFLAAPTARQQEQLTALEREITELNEVIHRRLASPPPGQDEWERRLRSGAVGAPAPPDDAVLHLPFDERDGRITWNEARERHACDIQGEALRVPGKIGQALLFGGETRIEFDKLGDFSAQDPFSVSTWVFPTTNAPAQFVSRRQPDDTQRGYSFGLVERRLTVRLAFDIADKLLEVRGKVELPMRKWRHVTAAYDGSGQAAGVRMWVDGEPIETDVTHDTLRGSIKVTSPLVVGGTEPEPFRGLLDDLRLFARELKPAEAVALAGLNPLREAVAIPPDRRTAEQTQALRREFLTTTDAVFRDADRRWRALNAEHEQLRRLSPTSMVMQELPEPRATHILARGRFDQLGERVTPGLPDWLASRDEPTRLGLARWIVSPDNPLTARVAVNRVWHEVFSQGLVRTVDDFGTHGDRPSHPELLDWLAVEFSSSDRFAWDVKRLIRELVVSATFRQANQTSGDTSADPENRLLSRGPRPRLTAEMLRDAALAFSGRIERRVGGPSAYPYQPPGLWEQLAFDRQPYVPSVGRDLYRRSLYTFWKRAVPPPTLAILDATDREVCTGARVTTTTPQQALVLLNDPTFVEAARGVARRAILDQDLRTADQRIAWMFRLISARDGQFAERRELERLYADEYRTFAANPRSTDAWLAVGESGNSARAGYEPPRRPSELAALTVVAHVILLLDENLTCP